MTTDTIEQATVLATVERVAHVSTAMAQPVTRTGDFVSADTGQPAAMTNWAVLLRPILDPDDPLVDEIAGSFPPGRPHTIVGPWPTPDLTHRGLFLIGHPPFMLRPPGPATADPGRRGVRGHRGGRRAIPGGRRKGADRGLPPARAPAGRARARLRRPGAGGPTRFFLGWRRDAPVATASVTVAHGVALVEFVATLADARGKGFGAMVTQAAALVDPTVPAVLIASDLGRPVYERLGFLPVSRWTLWMRA